MGLGNLGGVVIIIFIFSIIHMFLSLSIGIAHIKNNWDQYKCQPNIMPFASIFDHDPVTNLNECVKLQQAGFMEVFLEPIYKSLTFFAENGAMFTGLFENAKLFGLENQNALSGATGNIKDRFYSVLTESGSVFGNVSNTFSTLGSTISVVFNLILTFMGTADAAWGEMFGPIIRTAL